MEIRGTRLKGNALKTQMSVLKAEGQLGHP